MSGLRHVLVIDDQSDIRRLICLALRSDPTLTTDEADGGIAAMAKIEARCPDLIILDLMMPDMDGFEVCRRVRAHPESTRLPILLLTALTDPKSRAQGFMAGADDFLVKPFRGSDLRSRVRALLQQGDYAPTAPENRLETSAPATCRAPSGAR